MGNGFERGCDVGDVEQLIARLDEWMKTSDEARIGDSDYDRTAWVFFRGGERRDIRCHLNADTKREGVQALVARARTAPFRLTIGRNQSGKANKVLVDGMAIEHLYAYSLEEHPTETVVHEGSVPA